MSSILDSWKEFPKIGLIVSNKKKFYPLSEALPLWSSGFLDVRDSGEILLEDGSIRSMTEEENRSFQDLADDFSASK